MPWVKGKSGNPKGAPKRSNMLARLIRENTEDGLELVKWSLSVLRDETQPIDARQTERQWLSDRGWGKAVETIVLEDERATAPEGFPVPDLEDGLGPTGVVQ